MAYRDETGIALAPLIASAVAAPAFGRAWEFAFIFGWLFACTLTLALAWPLIWLMRRIGATLAFDFVVLGVFVSSPVAIAVLWLDIAEAARMPTALPGIAIFFAGALGGYVFWRLCEHGRKAL